MGKENRVEIWLNRALEMENRGRELYLDAAKKAGPRVGILEAIDKGLAFEREVRDYYKKEIPQAAEAGEKNFLTRLAAEENSHYQMLSDMKLFYSDPESWDELQDNMHLDGV